ncbi:MAG: carotenoid 1,2-hydratase [Myxococcota bacterium]
MTCDPMSPTLEGLGFDQPVPPGGYAWWYLDALSADGTEGLTIIAFIGSVFSPYYAWSGRSDPEDHCCLNVVVYRPRGGRWTMTERGRQSLRRDPEQLMIGPSRLHWSGRELVIDVNEGTFPFRTPVVGQVRLTPEFVNRRQFDLGDAHWWWPLAPRCRVEVRFQRPNLRWNGTGYLDSNRGDAPLETGFLEWNWSRCALREGAAILYDVVRADRTRHTIALRFDRTGRMETFQAPPRVALSPGPIWRVPRSIQSDGDARVVRTLEDTPFYTRSVVRSRLLEESVESVHESLSCRRFATRWVKALLTFRMPRNARSALPAPT